MFEDKELSDRAIVAVEKQIHHDDASPDKAGVTEVQEEHRRKDLV